MVSDQYHEERRWNAIVRISSILVIVITSMGLIGLTTLMIGRRIKEVGIRRVLGATRASLCLRLSRNFLMLGAAANLLAWPVGYYLMRQWLGRFPYRTGFPPGAFFVAGAVCVLVTVMAVGIQVLKTASANPSEILRCN
jgi:putative ABC transport system permease protein